MKELITAYLFQYKYCPLPGTGTLMLQYHSAKIVHGESKIAAPYSTVTLQTEVKDPAHFITFIAAAKNIGTVSAKRLLQQFCTGIADSRLTKPYVIEGLGNFVVNDEGQVDFIYTGPDASASQSAPAEKIIRKNESHTILVGDTETTNTEMSEYYNEPEPGESLRWLIGAMILLVSALAGLFFYFMINGRVGNTGNVEKLVPVSSNKTYLTN